MTNTSSPKRTTLPCFLKRLSLAACLIAFCRLASAQSPNPSYKIVPNITTLPAGAYGVNIHALLPDDTSAIPDVDLCFYTGYGSAAPLAAGVYYAVPTGLEATFDVLPSTIQEVPPSAFTNGTFPALMYTVPLGTAACTGTTQAAAGTAVTLTLEFPQISSLNLASAPQQNPNLTRRLPQRIEVLGSYFVEESTSTFRTPSHVVFTTGSAVEGDVNFITASDLVSTFPSAIPSTATSVNITVCNSAVYTYCSTPYTLPLDPLQSNFGTVTESAQIATPSQFVNFHATFGVGTQSTVGVPGGQVTFTDNGGPLYSAPLVLDHSGAEFAYGLNSSFVTTNSTSLQPFVADFNKDGVSDVLYIEPNVVSHGSQFPVLHLLLGNTPAGQPIGQFAADVPYTGLQAYPCATLLSAAVADFNSDGFPDLALLCTNPNSSGVIYVLQNRKNGTFSSTVASYGPVFGSRIVAADFNHDGKQDLVLAGPLNSAGDTGLQVLLGDGHAGFSAGPISHGLDTAPSVSLGGFQIAAADLNADGFPDIVILNGASSTGTTQPLIQLFQNDGTGAFTLATTVPTDGTGTATFLIAPIRSGQLPALIVTSSVYPTTGISVAMNSGTANIAFSSALKFTPLPYLTQAVAGDFNGDGFMDLAVEDFGSDGATQVFTGDGQGLFAPGYPLLATGSRLQEELLAAIDLNGDGYADLITAVTRNAYPSYVPTTTLYSYITSGSASTSTPGFRFATGAHRISANTSGTVEIAPAATQTELTITGTSPVIALSPSLSSPINFGNKLTLNAAISDPSATGTVTFFNGTALLGTCPVTSDGKLAFAHFTPPLLGAASYSFTAVYSGDATHAGLTSAPFAFLIDPISPYIFWDPNPQTIAYGTPLSAAQLDALATSFIVPLPTGTYTYSPPLGTVLPLGTDQIAVTFTSTSPNYTNISGSASIAVVQATPVITWPKPADVIVDTLLSATQLDATAATPQGAALPGTFVYTPPLGTKLSVAGTDTLSVLFTPTDTIDYTTATASVSINVGPIGMSSITPAAALLGDPSTTIAIVGTGFSQTSKVQIAGPSLPAVQIATTYIDSTHLSAVVPASDILRVQVLQVSVVDPTKDLPSNALPFAVTAPSTTVGFNAPSSISPASQNTVIFHLAPYPAPVTANFTLAFKPTGTLPDDPGIIFVDSGLRTASVTVPAHAAVFDLPITFQGGTVAGSLTLTLALDAGGADVTPASIQPIVIPEAIAVPGISSVTLTRNGDVLTVTTRGFSNTRDITGATFHFTPISGGSISTKDLKIDVNSLFSTWYANPESDPYGSLFTYSEVFNLSSDASVVGQVTVTLTNDVGASQEANTP